MAGRGFCGLSASQSRALCKYRLCTKFTRQLMTDASSFSVSLSCVADTRDRIWSVRSLPCSRTFYRCILHIFSKQSGHSVHIWKCFFCRKANKTMAADGYAPGELDMHPLYLLLYNSFCVCLECLLFQPESKAEVQCMAAAGHRCSASRAQDGIVERYQDSMEKWQEHLHNLGRKDICILVLRIDLVLLGNVMQQPWPPAWAISGSSLPKTSH